MRIQEFYDQDTSSQRMLKRENVGARPEKEKEEALLLLGE